MKKFSFRLKSVLQLKQQVLRQSQRRLAAISRQLSECEQRLHATQRELASLAGGASGESAVADWEANARYARLLESQLAAQASERQALRNEWLAERDVYQLADNEVQALEKLKEKQKIQHAYDMQRHESADIEEYVLRNWQRNVQP